MTATTYRLCCGTHLGLVAHQAADEPLCGECRRGELLRRAEVESWPIPVKPVDWRALAATPITRRRAAENLALLMEAMAEEPAVTALPALPPTGKDHETLEAR